MELLDDAQAWCVALNELMVEQGGEPVDLTDQAVACHEIAGRTVVAVDPGRITVQDSSGVGQWVAVFDTASGRWALEEGVG